MGVCPCYLWLWFQVYHPVLPGPSGQGEQGGQEQQEGGQSRQEAASANILRKEWVIKIMCISDT